MTKYTQKFKIINFVSTNKLIKIGLLTLIVFSLLNANTTSNTYFADEICDNGIDDDNDGLIDLNDDDCDCEIVDYNSMIPNPSFELRSCCPSETSLMDCVNDWIQASSATTDYVNICDLVVGSPFTPPIPFPDGTGCLRFINGYINQTTVYKEYAGTCLNYPMEKDSTYQFEFYLGFLDQNFSPDINISIFGSSDCNNLPFSSDTIFDCPSNHLDWSLLKSKVIIGSGGNRWKKITITIIPDRDISAIAVGPDCQRVEQESIYYLDNFILNKTTNFDFLPLETLSPCSPDFRFAVKDSSAFLYQWYKEGIALIGETASSLSQMYGEGAYQVRIINGTDCRISSDYIYELPIYRDTFSVTACKRNGFLFGTERIQTSGVYTSTFPNIDGCDSIVTINLDIKEGTLDTIERTILQGTTFEFQNRSFTSAGDYFITLNTIHGCDSIIRIQLKHSKIYIPNAFSPNFDGINDVFQIFGATDEIATVSMSIYDRWGNLLFVGEQWDGTANGKLLNTGVFVYAIQVQTTLGETVNYAGSVTLMQ